MPTYLPAPAWNPAGPDGQGWNRLSTGWRPMDQCALQPASPAALMDAWRGQAHWGDYSPCAREGECGTCPRWAKASEPYTLHCLDEEILIRVHPDRGPCAVNKPDQGWGSTCLWLTWDKLYRLQGWEWARFHRDETSDGFWLRRAARSAEAGEVPQ